MFRRTVSVVTVGAVALTAAACSSNSSGSSIECVRTTTAACHLWCCGNVG